jgi:hypothetical protein
VIVDPQKIPAAGFTILALVAGGFALADAEHHPLAPAVLTADGLMARHLDAPPADSAIVYSMTAVASGATAEVTTAAR